jgi:hypothetical protein
MIFIFTLIARLIVLSEDKMASILVGHCLLSLSLGLPLSMASQSLEI